jgi:hypothetical protein
MEVEVAAEAKTDGRVKADADPLVRGVEATLDAVEALPPEAREIALDALQALLELDREAWTRAVRAMREQSTGAAALQACADDPLAGHLLLLHGLHPRFSFDTDPYANGGEPEAPALVQLQVGSTRRGGESTRGAFSRAENGEDAEVGILERQ